MKSILIDIDIILDVLTKREPFFAPAANLWAKVEKKSSFTVNDLAAKVREVLD